MDTIYRVPTFECQAYTAGGLTCRKPATAVNERGGFYVCAEHAKNEPKGELLNPPKGPPKQYLDPKRDLAQIDLLERACRVCGCTEMNACVVDGTPCHWVEENLCSACALPDDI